MDRFILHGHAGWGSAIVEAQLAIYGLPFRFEDAGDLLASEAAREKLRPLNPLMQVPALELPAAHGGGVMTESAAITLHLADLTGRADLVPAPRAAERGPFLRWLVFIVANIYPTFAYADIPERFVKAEGAGPAFLEEVNAYARRLWGVVEAAAGTPHFLGQRFSALDLYLAVMTRWRPGPAWFAEHAPRLSAAAAHAAALPAVAPVFARNFPPRKA